jgi:hypothetical protein
MANHTSRETVSSRATYSLEATNSSLAGLDFDANGNPQILDSAGVARLEFTSTQGAVQWVKLAVTGASGSSGVFASLANPLGVNALIMRAVLRTTTQSTGAATLDIGVGANASTSNDGLFDGLSVAGAAAMFDSVANGGTNGKASQYWASTGFLNVAEASGDVDGLVGTLYVQVIPA